MRTIIVVSHKILQYVHIMVGSLVGEVPIHLTLDCPNDTLVSYGIILSNIMVYLVFLKKKCNSFIFPFTSFVCSELP